MEARSSEVRACSYLKDAEESVEAVQKMSDLLKFNNEQCKYLRDKLYVVVQSAKLFLKSPPGRRLLETTSSTGNTGFVEIFKVLMALGKQIENFVQGCSKDAWVKAAMALTNVSEYVSSLGFNLELCKVAFEKDYGASKRLTLDEVDIINKSEAELIGKRASVDARLLIEKVVLSLNSLPPEDRDLASYLLQRLLGINPGLSSENGGFLSNLFDWVKSGDLVGRGASATVYKAMWLGTQVAKKTFTGSTNLEFEKEVQILSRLCHPNVTSMFCCTKNTRNCSIIMELMDGDLSHLMDNRCQESSDSPPFPILEAVDIMLQIGEGVNYLHNQGIVHRDLKSRNILYRNVKANNAEIGYVHVKVADFGISKSRDIADTTYSDLTRNTGTNRWMPPEIIGSTHENEGDLASTGEKLPKYPFKLDSYSFGLVCYEILVGRKPFSECHNASDIKRRILNKERPILPCKSSECPLMLKALIKKCWSHEPHERPTFAVICRELKYIKYLLMTGGLEKQGVEDSEGQASKLEGFGSLHKSLQQFVPVKCSINKRPGSRDSLRSPSNYSGHPSSRVTENVQSSSMFWSDNRTRENIDHNRLARSKSGHLDNRGQSQTQSLYLPTSMPKSKASIAQVFEEKTTYSLRLREEIAARDASQEKDEMRLWTLTS